MMVVINLHMPSLFIGFLIGYIVIATVCLWIEFDDRWHTGFGKGWDCGKKFAEEDMRKEGDTNEMRRM